MTTAVYMLLQYLCGTVVQRSTLNHTLFPVTVPAGVWAVQPTTGKKPPPLCYHTFTKVDHHRAVVFAGHTGKCTNDIYMLDVVTWVRMCMYVICPFGIYTMDIGEQE